MVTIRTELIGLETANPQWLLIPSLSAAVTVRPNAITIKRAAVVINLESGLPIHSRLRDRYFAIVCCFCLEGMYLKAQLTSLPATDRDTVQRNAGTCRIFPSQGA